MEIREVPGPGVLLGLGPNWLLLDGRPSPTVRDALGRALGSGDAVADRVLDVLAGAAEGVRLVLLVVNARAVRLGLADDPEASGPPSQHAVPGLIDGIPPEILAGAPTAEPEGRTVRRDDHDHDGATVNRDHLVDHLQQSTHETVLAVRCPAGHLTAAFTPLCRLCRSPVVTQEPERVPRPRLGTLQLPTGESVPLDRGVVLGRRPRPMPGAGDWPHLVHLPQDSTYLSRVHLQIELDGWMVLARDLGSRGGTTLRVPGRPPQRIRPDESHVLEPGQVLDLADVYPVRFEVSE